VWPFLLVLFKVLKIDCVALITDNEICCLCFHRVENKDMHHVAQMCHALVCWYSKAWWWDTKINHKCTFFLTEYVRFVNISACHIDTPPPLVDSDVSYSVDFRRWIKSKATNCSDPSLLNNLWQTNLWILSVSGVTKRTACAFSQVNFRVSSWCSVYSAWCAMHSNNCWWPVWAEILGSKW